MNRLAILALVGLLAGCAGQPPIIVVDQIAVSLTGAEALATKYARLPQCPKAAPVCSEASVIAAIKRVDNAAYDAVKAAERSGLAADASAAKAAVAALLAAIPDIVKEH